MHVKIQREARGKKTRTKIRLTWMFFLEICLFWIEIWLNFVKLKIVWTFWLECCWQFWLEEVSARMANFPGIWPSLLIFGPKIRVVFLRNLAYLDILAKSLAFLAWILTILTSSFGNSTRILSNFNYTMAIWNEIWHFSLKREISCIKWHHFARFRGKTFV